MGWNTYYGIGGVFDERTILAVARSLISSGLARAGYRIVWLDYGWAGGARTASGQIVVNRRQWPHGLAWLTAWLHTHGLQAGIYTDAGSSGCGHRGLGSLHHYGQDANQFAAWGFDAVKVDFCGGGQQNLTPQTQYRQFAQALDANTSNRSMILNVCNFWMPSQIDGTNPTLASSAFSNYLWAPRIAQSWRTDTDIGVPHSVQFTDVLRNLDADASHPEVARPGHWNDPDYLAPELGMTPDEAQAQMTMWAILAAPLILGSDPRSLSAATIAMLENRQVISVDQDRRGTQGQLVATQGDGQVWAKPLHDGSVAVALLNRGTTPLTIATDAATVGLPPAAGYAIRDLWTLMLTTSTGAISAAVPPDSAVLYRVRAS